MKIKFIGHSCFLVTTGDGIRILTDPYEPGSYDGAVKYRPVDDEADVVLVSHGHTDHNYTAGVPGNPRVVDRPGETTAGTITILGVPCWHDSSHGSKRGGNIIFKVEADGLSFCHLGDLGHTLDTEAVEKLLPVDVLFLPVGGYFTLGSDDVDAVISSVDPKVVIPMHYKTSGVDFSIAPVDIFLAGRKGVRRPGTSEVDLTAGDVTAGILVLEPANLPR